MTMDRAQHGLGWIPDYPDFRDYTGETEEIRALLGPTGLSAPGRPKARAQAPVAPPKSVDLREWASAVEDQGQLGSCTAQAGAGVIEYYERKAFGRHIEASRLFL